jgi:hypothetical protein
LGQRGWAAFVVFCFFLSTPNLNQAKAREGEVSNGQKIELLLRNSSRALSGYRSFASLIQNLPREKDRDYLLATLGESAYQPVKVRFVEKSSLVLETSDGRSVLYVESPYRQHFQLYKHRFTFDPNENAETAIKRMRRIFNSKLVSRSQLVIPEAEAVFGIVGTGLVGALSLRTFIYLYLAMWGVTTSTCVQTNQASIGQCALLGLKWPGVAAVMAAGSIAAGFQKARDRAAPAAFELEDLVCQESGGTTLKATMRDERRDSLDVELRFTPKGEPTSLLLKPELSASRTIYFKPDWSIDTNKTSGAGGAIGSAALDLLTKGARSLLAVCQTTDSRKALEEYFFKTKNDPKVIPNVDESGISVKSVK